MNKCPECKSTKIQSRLTRGSGTKYTCKNCGYTMCVKPVRPTPAAKSIFIVIGRENHLDKFFQVPGMYWTDKAKAEAFAKDCNERDYSLIYKKQLWSWEVQEMEPVGESDDD